ncbi:PH domain-containing protein [Salininema proteolyticum]|uniref:PH domain-containing protein n=1 Tax=Salininema proteolyticum TaxID=1607685 RepID=A0ABV8U4B9_9ACTN
MSENPEHATPQEPNPAATEAPRTDPAEAVATPHAAPEGDPTASDAEESASGVAAWAGGERKRLHPLTPFLKIPQFFIPVLTYIVINLPFGQEPDFNFYIGLATAGLTVIGGFVSWFFTGYRVDLGSESGPDEPARSRSGPELQIIEGVLTRKRRSIPLSRLQSVEIAQPLLARFFGLAQLNLEVAGSSSTEAPLEFLTLPQATALRKRLISLSRKQKRENAGDTADEGDGGPASEEQEESPVWPIAAGVDNRTAGAAALSSVPFFGVLLVLSLAILAVGIVGDSTSAVVVSLVGIGGSVGMWGFSWFYTANAYWDFTLGRQDDDLRTRRGLLQKYASTIPLNRVTALRVTRPFLWRPFHWRKVDVATASSSLQGAVGGTLLYAADPEEADWVSAHGLPAVDFRDVDLRARPRRVWWRTPFTFRIRSCGLNPTAFVVREGVFPETTTFVPYARIQEVRVSQGPIQRLQEVATVHVRIAGSLTFDAVARHRDAAEAVVMARQLRLRADAAADAETPRLG